jgi:hypothetical protein
MVLDITKRVRGREHEASLVVAPVIVAEYGSPFHALPVNIETDLGVEAVAGEWRRCFRRRSDELRLSITLRETEETLMGRHMAAHKSIQRVGLFRLYSPFRHSSSGELQCPSVYFPLSPDNSTDIPSRP